MKKYFYNVGWELIALQTKLTVKDAKKHIPNLSTRIKNLQCSHKEISPSLLKGVIFYNENIDFLCPQ